MVLQSFDSPAASVMPLSQAPIDARHDDANPPDFVKVFSLWNVYTWDPAAYWLLIYVIRGNLHCTGLCRALLPIRRSLFIYRYKESACL